jgi:hypothetical protein
MTEITLPVDKIWIPDITLQVNYKLEKITKKFKCGIFSFLRMGMINIKLYNKYNIDNFELYFQL